MSIRTWKVHPIKTTVYEILQKKKSIVDRDLLEMLKTIYKDIGYGILNKTLMQMELSGLITVSPIMRNKRLIELKKS